jgi:hypothetical protein
LKHHRSISEQKADSSSVGRLVSELGYRLRLGDAASSEQECD